MIICLPISPPSWEESKDLADAFQVLIGNDK